MAGALAGTVLVSGDPNLKSSQKIHRRKVFCGKGKCDKDWFTLICYWDMANTLVVTALN
jgi:hypothetical protein